MPFLNTKKQVLGGLLLGVFALLQTVTLQHWIGQPNLYGPRETVHAKKTLELHEAILRNRPPTGKSWEYFTPGGVTLSHRVGTVYLAETLAAISGKSIFSVYKWLDHGALFFTILFLFLFLKAQAPPLFSLVGVLFFCGAQVTTYFYHYFQPWDRISQLIWVLGLWAVYQRRFLFIAPAIILGVITKYDYLLLGGVYFLFLLLRGTWKEAFVKGGMAFLVGVTTYFLVRLMISDSTVEAGQLVDRDFNMTRFNLEWMARDALRYPPILVFFVPSVFVFLGWGRASAFQKASAIVVAGAVPIYFCTMAFNETRAEMPLLIMMLPAALKGLQRCVEDANSPTCEEATP